jgi:hypothetical protein
MIEKGSTGRCHFDPASAAREQLSTNIVFKSPDLPAQRRLRRVQLSRCGHRQTSGVDDCDEITEMS